MKSAAIVAKELGMDPVAVLQETSRMRQAVRVAAALAISDQRVLDRQKQQAGMQAKQQNMRG